MFACCIGPCYKGRGVALLLQVLHWRATMELDRFRDSKWKWKSFISQGGLVD